MRTSPLILIVLLLGACAPLGAVSGWDPGGENCAANTAPFIDHIQVNSALPEDSPYWILVVGFDWADPGPGEQADPPNLLGGELSAEFSEILTEDILLTEELLETGCNQSVTLEGSNYCQLLTLGGGCPSGGVETCGVAALKFAGEILPVGGDETSFMEGDEIRIKVRLRDTCGMTSNDKVVNYTLGAGLFFQPEDEGA